MATTDAKTGFRLPWSSDRSSAPETTDPETAPAGSDNPWPATDTAQGDPGAAVESAGHPDSPSEGTVSAPISAPPRKASAKPTKFLADLTKAMQAAAESAREQTLTQFQADAKTFIELIHERTASESAALKSQADTDIDGIRAWSKAEIARIREETEAKITARKTSLEGELEDHAARIERQIDLVHGSVGAFEREMAQFFEELLEESDPARFASLAETMPEPPSFEDILPEAFESVELAAAYETSTSAPAQAEAAAGWAESRTDAPADTAHEAVVETVEAPEAELPAAAVDAVETVLEAEGDPSAGLAVPEALADVEPTGEPVDRAAVMAALEAAAEATVAAEMAAESASQAEVSADVAETAAELLAQKVEGEGGSWPAADFDNVDADAAIAARIDATDGELEGDGTSFVDRLASLMPPKTPEEEAADAEIRSTQVVVTGLVSVASIASFKRHVGRVPGVQAVGVSSGPDGEFVFTVSHRGDVNFRDALPTLPGFAARVTGTGEGVVNVTARDPESEA